jgi:DNA topoisomerase-1
LDREGEAIAWHLAQELGIPSTEAKRVRFPAITKAEIDKAFKNPHGIDEDRVNAQQARRILDRIVGYQVSPLLWKKVARGLSAGRVQSVAVRLVVEREREIRAFVPDEYWAIEACFTPEAAKAAGLAKSFADLLAKKNEKGEGPTVKEVSAWLADHGGFRAELVDLGGQKFDGIGGKTGEDLAKWASGIAAAAGLTAITSDVREDPKGKGPAKFVRTLRGFVDPATPYKVIGIETKRTTTRPAPPYITSTLQQAGSTRLGFGAQRTMRTAQSLYEGVDIPGEGPVGLITYMRTDSTHLSKDALDMARGYVDRNFGGRYLPEKPNFFTSSNKDAQEAHEAIRPTNVDLTPAKVRRALNDDQFRLYTLIWERFVACQMVNAEWDSTAVTIKGGKDKFDALTFRATGRVLAFDGFYKVTGVPKAAEEQILPALMESQPVAPFGIDPEQKFTQPPARYSEASLIKALETEGIGRPSTYASIISTILDRKYVEAIDRRLYASDLGEVVTDKLIEAFPDIMDLGYTREMENQLDKVEDDHLDWVDMLRKFYGPFKKSLVAAETSLVHAKAESTPAPYKCPKCGSGTVFKFGKNGRFLSCAAYPECDYASPVDRDGTRRRGNQCRLPQVRRGDDQTHRTLRALPRLLELRQQRNSLRRHPQHRQEGQGRRSEPAAIDDGDPLHCLRAPALSPRRAQGSVAQLLGLPQMPRAWEVGRDPGREAEGDGTRPAEPRQVQPDPDHHHDGRETPDRRKGQTPPDGSNGRHARGRGRTDPRRDRGRGRGLSPRPPACPVRVLHSGRCSATFCTARSTSRR